MIYIYDTASAQTSQKQDGHNTYVIIKTMFRPSHHQNVFGHIKQNQKNKTI